MSIADLFHWIQNTGWATDIRESALLYPIIMSLHLSAIAFFGGMILVTDLRLLGLTMTATPVSDVVKQLRPWKWAGFVIMITCGILLASSKADTYYPNPWFRIKILLLFFVGLHALAFRRSVYHNNTASQVNARLAACLSLVLWLGIVSMGRWIAYYEAEKPAFAPAAQATLR